MAATLDRLIGDAIARRYFGEITRLAGREVPAIAIDAPTLARLVALGIGEYKIAQARAAASVTSDKRATAARTNGKKGGRPRTRRLPARP